MQIDPSILAPHLRDAAVEQIVADCRASGYDVVVGAAFGGVRADVVARTGQETLVFGINTGDPADAERLKRLSAVVSDQPAARFRLVVAGLPRPVDVEIEWVGGELQRIAEDRIYDDLAGEASHFHSLYVDDIEYDLVRIWGQDIEVRGTATLEATLQYGSDRDVRQEDGIEREATFPIRFHLLLDHEMRIHEVKDFQIEREPGE